MVEAVVRRFSSVISKFCNIRKKTLVLESPFKKVPDLEAHQSIKRRLQHLCFPVNIAKFLSTAFSIAHLWWLQELRHFFSFDIYKFKIYEDSMTQA